MARLAGDRASGATIMRAAPRGVNGRHKVVHQRTGGDLLPLEALTLPQAMARDQLAQPFSPKPALERAQDRGEGPIR
jgi:hypothetical protein